jgi:hypothetical protein
MTVDPVTLDVRPLYHAPPGTLWAASVAVQVRDTLYVGSAIGDRLLEIDVPAVTKSHAKDEEIAVNKTTANIFGSYDLAGLALSNRIVTAPLIRSREETDSNNRSMLYDWFYDKS